MNKIEYQNNRFNNKQKTIISLFDCSDIVKNSAILSRFSRTKLGMDALLETTDGDDFYTRVLEGYGDDSVLEMGNIQLVIENISEVALREIISKRLGVSFIQKSTRYQPIEEFHTPSEFEEIPDFFDDYIKVMLSLKKQYSFFTSELEKIYNESLDINTFPCFDTQKAELVKFGDLKNEDDIKTSLKIFNASIKDKALDASRYLLPSSSYTSVAMNINGRALEYLLFTLFQSELLENKLLYKNLVTLLKPHLKPFIKRALDIKSEYLKKINNNENSNLQLYENVIENCVKIYSGIEKDLGYSPNIGTDIITCDISSDGNKVFIHLPYTTYPVIYKLTSDEEDRDARTAASILFNQKYRYYQLSLTNKKGVYNSTVDTGLFNFEHMYTYFLKNKESARSLIDSIRRQRKDRRDKIPRYFELSENVFEIHSSFGTFRDIQRHRTATIIPEKYLTTVNRYIVPQIIEDNQYLFNSFTDIMRDVNALYVKFLQKSKYNYAIAQYCTVFANIIKFIFKINDRALSHFTELRSQKGGHDEYRYIAQYIGKFIPSEFIDNSSNNSLNRYDMYIKNLIKTYKE